ncbi:hypothetical protein [Ensifer adhaerens]|uniref:hypothetical protein n=1 Tax=Ensifer adhaerens TaxID=106592 RepID=UPI000CF0FF19|nr:hypothetical protein [Ensifer adhaerens]
MIYVFCGLPSPHAMFVSRLGIDILRERFGDYHYIVANTLDQLRDGLAQRGERHALLYFDVPDDKICQSIVKHGVPTVLIVEPVEQAVLYSMQARSLSLLEALRFVSQSASALFPIASSETIVPLRLGTHAAELETLISRISLSLGFSLTTQNIQNILALYGQAGGAKATPLAEIIDERIEHAVEARSSASKLTKADRELISVAASNYDPLMSGEAVQRITWPVAMCLSGEKPHHGINGPVDMTGPARAMSFGPYMHLPSGNWRADVTFSVDKNFSGNKIVVDVLADGKIAALGKSPLPASGSFTVHLEFEVTRPHMPVEVRTFIGEGAIEGEFELVDVTLVRLDP